MNLPRFVSFPLLVKELTETAARRRTYVLRVVYAVALYGLFVLVLPRDTWNPGSADLSLLGIGQRVFEMLSVLQFGGIALFLPALMCGRITQEKERDSLVLLFLTELRPWSIVWQKYLGGILPMVSFLLLGLPLAGVAYALGGLEPAEIGRILAALALTILQIGALALMCSAWCRSTIGAFLATYFLGVALYAGPILVGNFLFKARMIDWPTQRLATLLLPVAATENDTVASLGPWLSCIVRLIPVLVSILIFLFLARRFLVRRAFVPSSNRLAALFARLDSLMKRFNRVTGGVVLWREGSALPGDAPVFWRETQRRALGKFHYLLRLLVLLEIPIIFLCILMATGSDDGFIILAVIFGSLSTLVISARAANALVSERVGQTLEVLLTTPVSAREILRQKERALRRIEWVVAIPLLTIFACKAYVMDNPIRQSFRTSLDAGLSYLTCSTLMLVIYLPMTTWLSLWIGLRVRTRFQAIVSALGAIVCWAGLSPLIFFIVESFHLSPIWRGLVLLSPISIPTLNEVRELDRYTLHPWAFILGNFALYAAVAGFIRYRLFADAERYLRR